MQIIVRLGEEIDFIFQKPKTKIKMVTKLGLSYFIYVFLEIPSSWESVMNKMKIRKPVQVIYFALCSSVLKNPSSI